MAYGNSFQRTTPAVLNLLIINVLCYVAQMAFGGSTDLNRVNDLFALHHYKSDEFRLYQVVTNMFMHGGILHLAFNMLALWMFGTMVERAWGPKKFLIFYFICGIAASFAQLGSYAWDFRDIDRLTLDASQYIQYQTMLRMNATVGASGAIMGILAAYAYLFPNTKLFIMPIPFPVKAKYAIMGIIALDVFGGVVQVQGDNIAHFAHLGGAVVGFILVYFWNKTDKQRFY